MELQNSLGFFFFVWFVVVSGIASIKPKAGPLSG